MGFAFTYQRKTSEKKKTKMLTQYMDSDTKSEMILKAIEIEHKSKSSRQFIENYIIFCFKENLQNRIWAPRT